MGCVQQGGVDRHESNGTLKLGDQVEVLPNRCLVDRDGVEYFRENDLGSIIGIGLGETGLDVEVMWARTGRSSVSPMSSWSDLYRRKGAQHLELGDLLQALPGRHFSYSGLEYYKGGDMGTVKGIALDFHDKQEVLEIVWDRTGKTTTHPKATWAQDYARVRSQRLDVGVVLQALPNELLRVDGVEYFRGGDIGTLLEFRGPRDALVHWARTGQTTSLPKESWMESCFFPREKGSAQDRAAAKLAKISKPPPPTTRSLDYYLPPSRPVPTATSAAQTSPQATPNPSRSISSDGPDVSHGRNAARPVAPIGVSALPLAGLAAAGSPMATSSQASTSSPQAASPLPRPQEHDLPSTSLGAASPASASSVVDPVPSSPSPRGDALVPAEAEVAPVVAVGAGAAAATAMAERSTVECSSAGDAAVQPSTGAVADDSEARENSSSQGGDGGSGERREPEPSAAPAVAGDTREPDEPSAAPAASAVDTVEPSVPLDDISLGTSSQRSAAEREAREEAAAGLAASSGHDDDDSRSELPPQEERTPGGRTPPEQTPPERTPERTPPLLRSEDSDIDADLAAALAASLADAQRATSMGSDEPSRSTPERQTSVSSPTRRPVFPLISPPSGMVDPEEGMGPLPGPSPESSPRVDEMMDPPVPPPTAPLIDPSELVTPRITSRPRSSTMEALRLMEELEEQRRKAAAEALAARLRNQEEASRERVTSPGRSLQHTSATSQLEEPGADTGPPTIPEVRGAIPSAGASAGPGGPGRPSPSGGSWEADSPHDSQPVLPTQVRDRTASSGRHHGPGQQPKAQAKAGMMAGPPAPKRQPVTASMPRMMAGPPSAKSRPPSAKARQGASRAKPVMQQ